MGMNILYGDRVGKNTLKFKDHTEIHITNPSMYFFISFLRFSKFYLREVSGLLMGDRILNFVKTAYFDDKTNHIIAELNFPVK